MPSSPKIPKKIILKAAFDLLIREGYPALNIKALAKELDCSTQPISWHFGNMDGLRRKLADYALSYANEKMHPTAENGFEAFTEVGSAYISIAFDEPNLFRFLYMDGSSGYCLGGLDALIGATNNTALITNVSELFHIPEENASRYMQNSIIYTHGIVSLIASGVMKSTKEQVKELVNLAGYAFLAQEGADLQLAEIFGNKLITGEEQ
ncbi:MAG: TetR/AcrR family transcriptional regulator [Lachnospiraceae bacterium]